MVTKTDKKKTIKFKTLVKEIRRLVKKAPLNVYTPVKDKKKSYRTCLYNKGKCSDGSTGCIFGQALRNLGFKPSDDLKTIEHLLIDLNIHANTHEENWASCVQTHQDYQSNWRDAVFIADQRFYLGY